MSGSLLVGARRDGMADGRAALPHRDSQVFDGSDANGRHFVSRFGGDASSRFLCRCGLEAAWTDGWTEQRAHSRCSRVFENANFEIGRGERIRTSDPLVPNQVRYQTALRPEHVAWWVSKNTRLPGVAGVLGWPAGSRIRLFEFSREWLHDANQTPEASHRCADRFNVCSH